MTSCGRSNVHQWISCNDFNGLINIMQNSQTIWIIFSTHISLMEQHGWFHMYPWVMTRCGRSHVNKRIPCNDFNGFINILQNQQTIWVVFTTQLSLMKQHGWFHMYPWVMTRCGWSRVNKRIPCNDLSGLINIIQDHETTWVVSTTPISIMKQHGWFHVYPWVMTRCWCSNVHQLIPWNELGGLINIKANHETIWVVS